MRRRRAVQMRLSNQYHSRHIGLSSTSTNEITCAQRATRTRSEELILHMWDGDTFRTRFYSRTLHSILHYTYFYASDQLSEKISFVPVNSFHIDEFFCLFRWVRDQHSLIQRCRDTHVIADQILCANTKLFSCIRQSVKLILIGIPNDS